MAKKSNSSFINQLICYALIIAALLGLVAIILIVEGSYAYEGIWCALASTVAVVFAGLWYGYKYASLPGVGGKVAYVFTAVILIAVVLFVPLYLFA